MFNCLIKRRLYAKQMTTFQTFVYCDLIKAQTPLACSINFTMRRNVRTAICPNVLKNHLKSYIADVKADFNNRFYFFYSLRPLKFSINLLKKFKSPNNICLGLKVFQRSFFLYLRLHENYFHFQAICHCVFTQKLVSVLELYVQI